MEEKLDSEISEIEVAEARDDSPTISDFRMRWFSILVVVVMTVVMVGAVMIANPHHPEIQWPDSEYAEIRYTGSKPVSAEYLDEIMKAYKLEPCVVGQKYGAVCHDGEVMHDASEDVCADHGGVKEWVTCK